MFRIVFLTALVATLFLDLANAQQDTFRINISKPEPAAVEFELSEDNFSGDRVLRGPNIQVDANVYRAGKKNANGKVTRGSYAYIRGAQLPGFPKQVGSTYVKYAVYFNINAVSSAGSLGYITNAKIKLTSGEMVDPKESNWIAFDSDSDYRSGVYYYNMAFTLVDFTLEEWATNGVEAIRVFHREGYVDIAMDYSALNDQIVALVSEMEELINPAKKSIKN